MNKRPGHVTVTIEHAYCSFCGRPRNLRREEHHLGALVRTIVTCETCHRTLSSSIGVAAEPEPSPPAAAAAIEKPVEAEAKAKATPRPRAAAAKPKSAAVKRAPARRTATRSAGKPTSTASRKVTRKKKT